MATKTMPAEKSAESTKQEIRSPRRPMPAIAWEAPTIRSVKLAGVVSIVARALKGRSRAGL